MFKRLEDIEVWKRGCRLAVEVHKLTERDPLSKRWSLVDQVNRSSLSIPSNIAEGYERNSRAEFKRFLMIAKGSCGELRTQLLIVKALDLAEKAQLDSFIKECREISSMIQGLANQINTLASK